MKQFSLIIACALILSLAGCAAAKERTPRGMNPDSGLMEISYPSGEENDTAYTKLAAIENAPVTEYELTAGFYTVGTDLPQGTYTIEWMSGHDKFIVLDPSGNFQKTAVFGDTIYGDLKGFKDVPLAAGASVEIYGSLKIKFTMT